MSLTARDLMTTRLATLDPDMTLAGAERVLDAGHVGGAPVVSDGRPVGVLSRADIGRALGKEQSRAEVLLQYFRDPTDASSDALERVAWEFRAITERIAELRVRDAMSDEPICVEPDVALEDVAAQMVERGVHRVLVTDGGRLRGVISSFDLMRLIAAGRLVLS